MKREEMDARTAKRRIKAKKKARRRRRMIAMFIVEAFLLALIVTCVFFLNKVDKIQRPNFEKTDIAVNEEIPEEEIINMTKGYRTFALFGVDARTNETLDKGTHGDVVMIASLNQDTGEIKLASIYRDTYLSIDSSGKKYGKMTTAYYNGGAKNAIETLNRNFDLVIEDYVTVNWAAVATAINDLGGVTVDVPESMMKDNMINGYITETVEATGIGSTQLTKAGVQNLDGVQAVAYCRIRYIAGSDYGRTERQREVLGKLLDKAKGADLGSLNKLANDVFPQVATNLTLPDILSLAAGAGKYYLGDQAGFPLEEHRGNANINGGSMVVPQTLEQTAIDLHTFLYGESNYEPSNTVKNISNKIVSDAQ